MTLLGLPLMFLATQVIFGLHANWKKSDPDTRYVNTKNVIQRTQLSRIFCASVCNQISTCLSFDHNSNDDTCEMIRSAPKMTTTDPALQNASGWSHYTISSPSKVSDSNLCTEGGARLPWDLPAEAGYSVIGEGYTCSSHPWIFKQHSLGMTDCRVAVMGNNISLWGYDIGGITGPFVWIIKQCLIYNCASMVCYNPNFCFLKYESQLTLGVNLTPGPQFYWYVACQ